ncbi:MAG: hypothetical protein A2149_02690 [Candidatus Schekmanbacteria bacterium RBG_16_38_11]|uniref:Pyridoxamine 5'-phosphate oxidase putative domain-containing protein n=2 Tax=Candidatus Schekmaniibacteriota TaxID=1817811 RepID=A0A1F7RJV5_9BACT|nr:MAG: hypothetical protein A2042_02955 [Candidatus Schekmanbacteria bacterium GWA2_38_11]OGL44461.1 MAG: hypothetical protein A2149_02690 [Candidatus Schekmanbacteria bacterium RBG_16_38_11]
MRDMTEKEIRDLIEDWTWGTIIAVDDGKPYAIEVSYGSDEKNIYCGSRPNGKMAKILRKNPEIIFKICDADKFYPNWRGVSVFAKAEILSKKENIMYGIRQIAKRVIYGAKRINRSEEEFLKIGERMAAKPEAGNALRIPIEKFTGRINK